MNEIDLKILLDPVIPSNVILCTSSSVPSASLWLIYRPGYPTRGSGLSITLWVCFAR
jgi:hypothetical protein